MTHPLLCITDREDLRVGDFVEGSYFGAPLRRTITEKTIEPGLVAWYLASRLLHVPVREYWSGLVTFDRAYRPEALPTEEMSIIGILQVVGGRLHETPVRAIRSSWDTWMLATIPSALGARFYRDDEILCWTKMD